LGYSSPGSGGGGAYVLVASRGVFFSGTAIVGSGVGVIDGDLFNTGRFVGRQPFVHPYSFWDSLSGEDFYLTGGAGGGGAGGDGQLEAPLPIVIGPGEEAAVIGLTSSGHVIGMPPSTFSRQTVPADEATTTASNCTESVALATSRRANPGGSESQVVTMAGAVAAHGQIKEPGSSLRVLEAVFASLASGDSLLA
jgi:hypothetical protein